MSWARACAVALAMTGAGVPALVPAAPRYSVFAVRGAGSVARLRAERGDEGLLQVLKVNRMDLEHAMRADTLILPDRALGALDLSPFPATLPAADSLAKVLFVSLRVQAFGAYESGRLVRWGPVCSGGSSAPSEPGRYWVNWKGRQHVSTVDTSWVMPYTVNIDARVGTAFHWYTLPGRPASHCCIRLLEEDARWVYEWVDTWTLSRNEQSVVRPGTPVVLFGAYDFAAPPPWALLPADPEATSISTGEIDAALMSSAR